MIDSTNYTRVRLAPAMADGAGMMAPSHSPYDAILSLSALSFAYYGGGMYDRTVQQRQAVARKNGTARRKVRS